MQSNSSTALATAGQSTDLDPGRRLDRSGSSAINGRALWQLNQEKQGRGLMGPQGQVTTGTAPASERTWLQGPWAALATGLSAGEGWGSPQQQRLKVSKPYGPSPSLLSS